MRLIQRITLLLAALASAGCATAAPGPPTATQPAATTASTSGPVAATPAGSEPAPRALLVDTDVAGDDLIALAFLVASPRVQLVGITVSGTGEAHCAAGVDVVLRLLERLQGPDIPVACGREMPLTGTHTFPSAWRDHVDGGSGLQLDPTDRTPSTATAVELISSLTAEHEPLTLLTLGPLTNLADALLAEPAIVDRLGPVFVMGGALHVPGNLVCCGAPEGNAVAEWNIYVDPRAANIVVQSGLMPSFVSLDGTNQVPLTAEFARRVIEAAESEPARLAAELFEANPFMTEGSYYLWDSLAAQLAAGYPVGTFSPARIVVEETEGPESGFTRPVQGDANIQYLDSADARAAEDTLLQVLTGG